ncbi:MAG: hypothetical protein QRY72_04725 [Candidatus Rhabdochlamydia sp.]
MKLTLPLFCRDQRFLTYLCVLGWAVCLAATGWRVCRNLPLSFHQEKKIARLQKVSITLPLLKQGALSLGSSSLPFPLSQILEDIMPVAVDTRPKKALELSLLRQATPQLMKCVQGDTFFLKQQSGCWDVSDERETISLHVERISKEIVSFQIKDLSEGSQEKTYLVTLPSSELLGSDLHKTQAAAVLKEAVIYPEDLLLEEYDLSNASELRGKVKLLIGDHTVFLSSNDTLVWKEGRWVMTPDLSYDEMISQLCMHADGTFFFKMWDETGNSCLTPPLETAKIDQELTVFQDVVSLLKVKDPHHVSCFLGKQKVVLQQGDWWLKRGQVWKKICTLNDLTAYLHHTLQGDLVVIEQIEILPKKITLSLLTFNQMRTVCKKEILSFPKDLKKIVKKNVDFSSIPQGGARNV